MKQSGDGPDHSSIRNVPFFVRGYRATGHTTNIPIAAPNMTSVVSITTARVERAKPHNQTVARRQPEDRRQESRRLGWPLQEGRFDEVEVHGASLVLGLDPFKGRGESRSGRVDLAPLLTHKFPLDKIGDAYELFGGRADGVLKVAIKP